MRSICLNLTNLSSRPSCLRGLLRLVLGLDFLSPLTFRSGTTIPGDVVIAGFYGLMTLALD